MKFNFEKHIKTPEPETKKEELNDEQIEANYEQEILAETKKLGTNLASLKSEIDALGGPEKFKEYFEKPVLMENGNDIRKGEVGNIETRGSYEIQKLSQKIKEKISLKAAVALASIMNFMHIYGISMMNQNMGNKNIQEYFSQETMQTIINNFNNFSEKNAVNQGVMITGLMLSAMILSIQSGAIYTGIKDAVEKRKLKREKAKQELKFKMTDTDIDKKFN